MGYNDYSLRLAAAEAMPNGGASPGGLGGTSITASATTANFIDTGASNPLGLNISDLASSEMELHLAVTTAFTAAVNVALDVRLVSLPISPTLLTNATTAGKRTHTAAAVTTAATPGTITIANHTLPLGTPIYLSALATTTGPSTNTIYYVIPLTANTFAVATSLANAIAGTAVTFATGDGTATVEFLPFIHAVTGPIPAPFLQIGARFVARTQPWTLSNMGKSIIPTGQTVAQQYGAAFGPTVGVGGGGATNIAQVPGRYLCLQFVPSGTMSTGAVTVDLALHQQNSFRAFQTGVVVK